jgi:hypothetical protein
MVAAATNFSPRNKRRGGRVLTVFKLVRLFVSQPAFCEMETGFAFTRFV